CQQEPAADGSPRFVVNVHRAGVPAFVLPGDVVVVEPLSGIVEPVSARVEDVGARGLRAVVLSDPSPLTDGELPCVGGQPFDARLSFVRRSSPSADLYGLGMLLLRVLLVHDEQTLAEVAASVERCLQQLAAAVDDGSTLADRWQEILAGDDGEGRFASWNVMHRHRDRQAVFDAELKGQPIVPSTIWSALLALAGRLLLASPIARGSEPSGRSPLVGVLEELSVLEQRLHVELLDRDGRDRTLAAICSERAVALRAELGQSDTETDLSGAAGSQGFVLAVGRSGESAIQQYRFTQNRVTIGRREGDNVLHLPDAMVSSRHAVIEFADGEYSLIDRGSTNGTEVDGIRLPIEVPHPLDDGAVIHIRPFLLSFRRAESVAMQTATVPLLSTEELRERLSAAYAQAWGRSDAEVRAGLCAALDDARASLGRKGLLASLDEILASLGAPAGRDADGDRSAETAGANGP
ncbi:MAG TPA: FHA domain-containing protein, partial [bacterium]|nr:FHA domain-containing protein [bacterium]